jgi:hypothetical protein
VIFPRGANLDRFSRLSNEIDEYADRGGTGVQPLETYLVSVDRFGPILDLEAWHSSEFPSVVRHQSEPKTACVGRNEQIVRTNHGAAVFEGCANLSIVKSRFVWIFEDLNAPPTGTLCNLFKTAS